MNAEKQGSAVHIARIKCTPVRETCNAIFMPDTRRPSLPVAKVLSLLTANIATRSRCARIISSAIWKRNTRGSVTRATLRRAVRNPEEYRKISITRAIPRLLARFSTSDITYTPGCFLRAHTYFWPWLNFFLCF